MKINNEIIINENNEIKMKIMKCVMKNNNKIMKMK